jgi:predicted PurR-regulated permease PerM
MLILFIVALVLYYNYILVLPFLRSMILALTCAVCLSPTCDALIRALDFADARATPPVLAAAVSAVGIVAIAAADVGDLARLVMALLLLAADYAILFMSRRQVVATALTFAVAIMLSFPFFFFIRSCAEESRKFPVWVTRVLDRHPELRTLFTDYRTHASFIQLESYLASWGLIVPPDEEILAYIDHLSRYAAGHVSTFFAGLISSVVSNAGDFALSTSIFFSSLYYFLLSKESLVAEIARLSPFAAADNARLYRTIYSTTNT